MKLPNGFRHLFPPKEIEEIQEQVSIRFDQISFGHLLDAVAYQSEEAAQSAFHPVTVTRNRGVESCEFVRVVFEKSCFLINKKQRLAQVLSSCVLKVTLTDKSY